MNVGRVSTSTLEQVLLDHGDIAEAAVVGVPDEVKGQIPLGLYVLKKDSKRKDQIQIAKLLSSLAKIFI